MMTRLKAMTHKEIGWDDIEQCTHCTRAFDVSELEQDLLGDYTCLECKEAKEMMESEE